MKTGNRVTIECGNRKVDGHIILASDNEVSLMLGFEAIIDGHVGMMPVLRHADGYRSVLTGAPVTITVVKRK